MPLWARFLIAGQERFGTVDGDRATPYRGDMFGENEPDGDAVRIADVELLPPCNPRSFIGLWNNFHELADKFGYEKPEAPLYFLKSTGSVLKPGGMISRPTDYNGKILYEGELGVVVGQQCRNVDEETAQKAIFGYTCVNDVTAVEWLSTPAFPQWARAKSCDSFGPFGPVIATGLDWSQLRIRSILNGRERQSYPASDMILSPAKIISLLSREITLMPGDLIACGTSVGALPMRPGNVIEIAIEGIGTLTNTVEGGDA